MASDVPTGRGEQSGDVIERVGFVCLTCLCVAAGIAFAVTASRTSAQPALPIDDTINPNDASPASLARLPRIGPARAQMIVSYRDQARGKAARPVFGRAEDLRSVSGIGPATIEAVRPWLSFDPLAADGQNVAVPRP